MEATVYDFETKRHQAPVHTRSAFEAAGVKFPAEDGENQACGLPLQQ